MIDKTDYLFVFVLLFIFTKYVLTIKADDGFFLVNRPKSDLEIMKTKLY